MIRIISAVLPFKPSSGTGKKTSTSSYCIPFQHTDEKWPMNESVTLFWISWNAQLMGTCTFTGHNFDSLNWPIIQGKQVYASGWVMALEFWSMLAAVIANSTTGLSVYFCASFVRAARCGRGPDPGLRGGLILAAEHQEPGA